MYLLVMRFEIPSSKLYEFDLTLGRLVKWPIYALHGSGSPSDRKIFELVRSWGNETLMNRELDSPEYRNLTGAIKVLGEILESKIYNSLQQTNLLQEQ
jgi:hypothetical protein